MTGPDFEEKEEFYDREDSECGPHELAARRMSEDELNDLFGKCGFDWDNEELGFAELFPDTFARLTKGNPAAKVHWPSKGIDEALGRIILLFLESSDQDFSNEQCLFYALNREIRNRGGKQWPEREFSEVAGRVRDEIDTRDNRRSKRLVTFEGGRQPSDTTRLMKRICKVIGCGRRHAYNIAEDGTAVPKQQQALARAFAADPRRNKPSDWWPKERARTHGRVSVNSFRAYILSGADAFEPGDLGKTIAAVRPLMVDGWLLDNPRLLEDMLADLKAASATVTTDQGATLWAAFKRWRKLQEL